MHSIIIAYCPFRLSLTVLCYPARCLLLHATAAAAAAAATAVVAHTDFRLDNQQRQHLQAEAAWLVPRTHPPRSRVTAVRHDASAADPSPSRVAVIVVIVVVVVVVVIAADCPVLCLSAGATSNTAHFARSSLSFCSHSPFTTDDADPPLVS